MQLEGATVVSGAEAFGKGKEGQEHGDVIPATKEEKEVRLRAGLPIPSLSLFAKRGSVSKSHLRSSV